jgi:hypothetical protein
MTEVSGRANGIPFSESGDEEQNKLKKLKDFWWPFDRQDNRIHNESYCPQLHIAGGYRIYSCIVSNASYVEKMMIRTFTKEKDRSLQINCDIFNYFYHKFILCFLLLFMSNSMLCLKKISEMTVGIVSSRALANFVYPTF